MSKILDSQDERLQKLWGHLGHMSPEELREHIRLIRADRRVAKVKTATKVKTKVTSDSARTKIKGLMEGLSEEQIERLLKGLK